MGGVAAESGGALKRVKGPEDCAGSGTEMQERNDGNDNALSFED
jgi:hypothetical protein